MYGQPGPLCAACAGFFQQLLAVEHRLCACMRSSCSFSPWSTGSAHACAAVVQQLWLAAVELGLSSCGSWAYLVPQGMWSPPRPGIEPMYPALAPRWLVKNLPLRQETRVQSLGQEDPLEKGMTTHSSILAWRSPSPSSSCVWNPRVFADDARGWQCPFVLCLHREAWCAAIHGVAKSQT